VSAVNVGIAFNSFGML